MVEKQNILNYDFDESRVLKIQALAGAGKSTTMMEFVLSRPKTKFLYIVYNVSMKDEALKKFKKCNNVEIYTIHGLAYRYVGEMFRKDDGTSTIVNNYTKLDLLDDLGYDRENYEYIDYYNNLYDLYVRFLNSQYRHVDDFIKSVGLSHLKQYTINQLCSDIKRICAMKVKLQADCEHDFYLKIFHKVTTSLPEYDCIILDESQDGSGVLLDILKCIDNNVVVVGDKWQNLYSWRHTVNMINELSGTTLPLTKSFRVGNKCAEICNLIIGEITEEDIGMSGVNYIQRIVDKIDMDEQHAVLFRLNASLMDYALENAKQEKGLYFVGGLSSYPFNDILSLSAFASNPSRFKKRVYAKVFDSSFAKFLCKFDSLKDIIKYAKNMNDVRIQSYCKTILKAFSSDRNLFEEYDIIKKNTIKSLKYADIILSTVHKSKGMTLGNTIVYDDVMNMNAFSNLKNGITSILNEDGEIREFNKYEHYEDMYILYVAITRSEKDLVLPTHLVQWLKDVKKITPFDKTS